MPFVVFGLALLAVVAEFTAGAAGKETGLASRILEASFRTEIPEMFAGLVLVSLTGIMIYLVFTWVSKLVLGKWHESEIKSSRQEPGRISQSNSHHEI
jgi:NitT/TauT family transport system permease protein